MDALALLCSLHADGPSTLKSLRQAGCGSLESIESMPEERLSRVLGGPPAVARRFVREARNLRERLDPVLLDREEGHVDPPLDAVVERPAEPIEAPRDPMADVLEAWRARDEIEAAAPPAPEPAEALEHVDEEAPPRPVRARPEFEFGAEIVAAMRELESTVTPEGPIASAVPEEVLSARRTEEPLVAGLSALFEGEENELVLRLGEEGVGDLRELTDDDVLELSRRLGFGYTRILRVVQLARRAVTEPVEPATPAFGAGVLTGATSIEMPEAPADVEPATKISPADRPPAARPSILELEWNLEIRPQAPPHGHALSSPMDPDARREGPGGPFA